MEIILRILGADILHLNKYIVKLRNDEVDDYVAYIYMCFNVPSEDYVYLMSLLMAETTTVE